MDTPTPFDEFLIAVDQLRGDDSAVHVTAHTSNVDAAGWPPVDNDPADADRR